MSLAFHSSLASKTFRLLALVGALSCAAGAQTYHYASISYPGAQSTVANGINNNNAIVGSYVDVNNQNHGFLYKNGHFTVINVPNAISTSANGINDYGDIVGTFSLPGTPNNPANTHGFRLHNGAFQTIDCANTNFSGATGINKYGTIVGSCETSNGTKGFIYKAGTFTMVNAPTVGTNDTQLNGISNLGEIAGQVFSGDSFRGFSLVGSDLDFVKPYQAYDNKVEGVNGHGDLVGCFNGGQAFIAYNTESGETEGTSEKFPVLHALSPLGSKNACVMSINYTRAIVGWYYDTKFQQHGFFGVAQ